MTIDPKFTFWFGVWTNVLTLVAGYGVEHAPAMVAQYAPSVQWLSALAAQVNSVVLTALVGISSTMPGPLVKMPAITPNVVKILLLAFLPLVLLAAPSAHAQTGNIIKDIATARAKTVAPKVAVAAPAAPAASGLQKFMDDLAALQKKVVDDTVADLAAADADAATLTNANDPTSFRDPIAHACYPAATKFLQSLPAASPTTGTLIAVQLFQKQRDFVAQIQAGLPVYLKLGCAPLLGDEAATLTKVLGLVGVTVAANTLLPGISAIMPVLP